MKTKAQQYLETHILTAPREDLLVMLFDGAIRFAGQAKPKIASRDFEGSCKLLIKAQRIVIELMTSLQKDLLEPAVYQNLMGLYNFVYFRLVNANVKKDAAPVDEALKILVHLRETWAMAIDKNRREQNPQLALIEQAQKAQVAAVPARGGVNLQG